MQAPGRRGGGPTPLGGRISPRGSASRERNHGVGDHPIPFRTRQLSPTSPKVLRREAAGGQVVPLAGGAFSRSVLRHRRIRGSPPPPAIPRPPDFGSGAFLLCGCHYNREGYLDEREGKRLVRVTFLRLTVCVRLPWRQSCCITLMPRFCLAVFWA